MALKSNGFYTTLIINKIPVDYDVSGEIYIYSKISDSSIGYFANGDLFSDIDINLKPFDYEYLNENNDWEEIQNENKSS